MRKASKVAKIGSQNEIASLPAGGTSRASFGRLTSGSSCWLAASSSSSSVVAVWADTTTTLDEEGEQQGSQEDQGKVADEAVAL